MGRGNRIIVMGVAVMYDCMSLSFVELTYGQSSKA